MSWCKSCGLFPLWICFDLSSLIKILCRGTVHCWSLALFLESLFHCSHNVCQLQWLDITKAYFITKQFIQRVDPRRKSTTLHDFNHFKVCPRVGPFSVVCEEAHKSEQPSACKILSWWPKAEDVKNAVEYCTLEYLNVNNVTMNILNWYFHWFSLFSVINKNKYFDMTVDFRS